MQKWRNAKIIFSSEEAHSQEPFEEVKVPDKVEGVVDFPGLLVDQKVLLAIKVTNHSLSRKLMVTK